MEKHAGGVIPAKAGIQEKQILTNCDCFCMKIRDFPNILKLLDSHFRGNDTRVTPGHSRTACFVGMKPA